MKLAYISVPGRGMTDDLIAEIVERFVAGGWRARCALSLDINEGIRATWTCGYSQTVRYVGSASPWGQERRGAASMGASSKPSLQRWRRAFLVQTF